MTNEQILKIINSKLKVIYSQLNSGELTNDPAKARYLQGGYDALHNLACRIIEG